MVAVRSAIVIVIGVFGVLLAASGLVWTLQGVGVLGGSPMSNTTTWSIIGPITVVVGLAIAYRAWRARRRRG